MRRRIRSLAGLSLWAPRRYLPANMSPSKSAMNSWKSSGLPLWGVADINKKWRATASRRRPSL